MDLQLLFSIAIILILAKVFGELAERIKLPALAGEIIAGIMAGPLLHLVMPTPYLSQIAWIGIILFMFLAGSSIKAIKASAKFEKNNTMIAVVGSAVSFAIGFITGYLIFQNIMISFLVGIVTLSTSSLIIIRSLTNIGELHSKIAQAILSIGLITDIISIITIAIFTGAGFGLIAAVAVIAFIITLFASLYHTGVSDKIIGFLSKSKDENFILSLLIVGLFVVSFAFERFTGTGIAAAFVLGVFLGKSQSLQTSAIPKVRTIGYGIFIPLFFAYSSIYFQLSFPIIIAFALLVVGILVKIVVPIIFFRYWRMPSRQGIFAGISLIPKGEFCIIAAYTALATSIINPEIYSIIISTIFASIIIGYILMKTQRHV